MVTGDPPTPPSDDALGAWGRYDALGVPSRIGPWKILGLLGSGGTSLVFDAQDEHRRVALKVLRPGRTDADARAFLAEGDTLARLKHPAFPTFHARGVTGSILWMALERVEGKALSRWARKHDPAAVLDVIIEICDALEEAHHEGLVHRDLDPSNVLVTASGHARVMDFGMATRRDCTPPDAPTPVGMATRDRWTGTLGWSGTPGWVAPEVAAREPWRVGPATDVWAIGRMTAQLLGDLGGPAGEALLRVLQRATDDAPEARHAHAGELGRELRWVRALLARGPRSPLPRRVARVVGVGVAVAAVGIFAAGGAIAVFGSGKLGFQRGTAAGMPPPPVFGGSDADTEDAPFTVALLDGDEVTCAGVLVTPELVLTAAHCTITADTVVADTLDLQAGGERRGIVDAARHPDWSSDTGLDAALVLLDAPIEGVAPALLDSPCRDLPAEGSTAHVYGWGATREDGVGSSPVLQRGAVEVTDPTCTTTPTCRGAVDGELVAAGSGVDACVGDSGGPLVDEDGVVIGIVARGLDGESACGAGGVYTRVAALRAWMEESSAVPDNEEVCEGCGGCRSAGGGAWLWVAGLAVLVRRRRGSTPQFARH